jgi:hypothetical protein
VFLDSDFLDVPGKLPERVVVKILQSAEIDGPVPVAVPVAGEADSLYHHLIMRVDVERFARPAVGPIEPAEGSDTVGVLVEGDGDFSVFEVPDSPDQCFRVHDTFLLFQVGLRTFLINSIILF